MSRKHSGLGLYLGILHVPCVPEWVSPVGRGPETLNSPQGCAAHGLFMTTEVDTGTDPQCFAGVECTRKPASDKHFMLFDATGVVFVDMAPFESAQLLDDWRVLTDSWPVVGVGGLHKKESQPHSWTAGHLTEWPIMWEGDLLTS